MIATRRIIHVTLVHALPACAALALIGCGDNRVAGTSSGVDNPALTVAFRDSSGLAMRVTGDLNVYAHDQNPAVDPEPLWTVKVRNSALANLTGDDFTRINQYASKLSAAAAAKTALPANAGTTLKDSAWTFNLTFKGQSQTGAVIFGLVYDPAAKAFSRAGDGAVSGLNVHPENLAAFRGRLGEQAPALTGLSRVYVPGTDFIAILVDTGFAFEALPAGTYPLRILSADGRVFAVRESLDTRVTRAFTVDTVPIQKITPPITPSDSAFKINAGPNREVFVGTPAVLSAVLIGAGSTDARLSVLWRLLGPIPADSLHVPVRIENPTSLETAVAFFQEGAFQFEVSATIGLVTTRDTVLVSAFRPPPPTPRIVKPAPGDTVVLGSPTAITWQLPAQGAVRIELSLNHGQTWTVLADKYENPDHVSVFPWTPDNGEGSSDSCLIKVSLALDSTVTAAMDSTFHLLGVAH